MQELDKITNDFSYKIIGAAIEVHRILGPGLLESVYEEALCIELGDRNIPFEQQKIVGIDYKGHSIGDMRADIIVANRVIIELKAVERIMGVHKAQVLTYLKVTKLRLGLLINFNTRTLKEGIERIIL